MRGGERVGSIERSPFGAGTLPTNIELRPDEEWKVKMRGADKNVVTALTAPLLLKYGYLRRMETSKC
jgi:hypothetical protein